MMDEIIPTSGIAPGATEEQFLALWLHGKKPKTAAWYRRESERFRTFLGKPLHLTYLSDFQAYMDTLDGMVSTRARRVAVIKAMFTFAYRIGYVRYNVGAVVRAPKPPNTLAERILDQQQVFAMLHAVRGNPRDHALLRVLYNGALRVSEVVGIRWKHLIDRVVIVHGKGDKTRVVRLSQGTWDELQGLRPRGATAEDLVFDMRPWNAWDRVKRAARKAGLEAPVSPHFLRHAHATHALQRGSDITTVRDTLGHASIATTDRYLHARPGESSGDYLEI